MNKKLFRVGGKVCYFEGGMLKEYKQNAQIGMTINPQYARMAALADQGQQFDETYFSPSANEPIRKNPFSNVNWMGAVDTAGKVASTVGARSKPYYNPDNQYTASATKGYNDDSFNQGLVATAGSIPVYGPIINAFQALGTGMSNAIKNKDEDGISKTGAGEVFGNIIHPGEFIGQSRAIGKKYKRGKGWNNEEAKNIISFGTTGRNLMKKAVSNANDFNDFIEDRQNMSDKSNFRNDSIYAKYGTSIKMKHKGKSGNFEFKAEPNVEIEDGEIVLFPDTNPNNVRIFGKGGSKMVSKYGAKFYGDKHGKDTDKDGMEGINLLAKDGTYVASNYLGVDGKKAKKGKTVADEMTPSIEYLANAEVDSQDRYKNNPIAIQQQLGKIAKIKKKAERNKFKEQLKDKIKDKKTELKDVLEHLNNAPMEDLNPDEQQLVMNMKNKKMYMNGGKMPKKSMMYQMGGEMPQEQQAPNSSQRMQQLEQQAMGMEQGNPGFNAMTTNMNPEVAEMLSQLPPEVQEEIMALPPDQQEAAIERYMMMMRQQEMAMQQQGQAEQMQAPQGQEVPQEEMDQAIQMMFGGSMSEKEEKARLKKRYMAGGYSKTNAENMAENKMNEFQQGGMTYKEKLKQGTKVRFKKGGKVYEGIVKEVKPNGSFKLM